MTAAVLSLAAVAVVSVAVWALEPHAPVVSLGVLYLFAVLPVAALWGLPFAIPVSIVSMLAFNWLFLPPTHTFRLADSENWVALAVYLVTAISVSALSDRARRRTEEAEERRREASAADTSSLLLIRHRRPSRATDNIAMFTARHARRQHTVWIELDHRYTSSPILCTRFPRRPPRQSLLPTLQRRPEVSRSSSLSSPLERAMDEARASEEQPPRGGRGRGATPQRRCQDGSAALGQP